MADLSILCEACHRIFKSRSGDKLPLQNVQEQKAHHSDVSEFLAAVESGCFICSTVWEHANAQFKAAYTRGWELAMTYHLYLPEDETEAVRLVIRHLSELIPIVHFMVFRLVRAKGVLIAILSLWMLALLC